MYSHPGISELGQTKLQESINNAIIGCNPKTIVYQYNACIKIKHPPKHRFFITYIDSCTCFTFQGWIKYIYKRMFMSDLLLKYRCLITLLDKFALHPSPYWIPEVMRERETQRERERERERERKKERLHSVL